MTPQLHLTETTRYLHIEGDPWSRWFKMHRVEPDPNPFPRFRVWRWWPTKRAG